MRAFGAKRVLLFGSFAHKPETACDIDLAVEGIPLGQLLEADVRVNEAMGVPVDLVSREESPQLYELIRGNARVLHDDRTDSRAN